MSRKENILITGASGFIGSFLVDEAIKRGYNVFVSVRKTTKINQLKKKQIELIEIDFVNIHDLHQKISSLPKLDYVIHNAGVTRALNEREFFDVNFENTKKLIQALKNTKNAPSKFIFVSSLAAFGPGKNNEIIENETLAHPLTAYGKSKLAAEQFIIHESKTPYLIIRPTAVYGPRDKDFLETLKLINKGIDFKIGKQPQLLTFIFVKDLARLIFDALASSFSNKAYFVSDGKVYSQKDLGLIAARRLNKKVRSVAIPLWVAKIVAAFAEFTSKIKRKPSVLRIDKIAELAASNWKCDVKSIFTDFSFIAEYDLEKGINETIDWYKKEGWLK